MSNVKSRDFNFWFNIFILAGMTVAMICTTAFKLSSAESGKILLLISAFGSLMGVLANVCSANGMILTFLFGLLDVSIYGVMCLVSWAGGGSGLGNGVLHLLYFLPMQFIGFHQWRRRGAREKEQVSARRQTPRQRVLYALIFLAGAVAASIVIAWFDRSAAGTFFRWAIIFDAVSFVCNIIGQWLMSSAYMEQWIFWIIVNVSSILMWSAEYSSGASSAYALIYIIKYSFYLLNALNGLRIWIQLSRGASE